MSLLLSPLVGVLKLVQLVVVLRVLLTWFYPDPYNQPLPAVTKRIDNMLRPFRVRVPLRGAMLELGPLLFLLLLEGIQRVLFTLAFL